MANKIADRSMELHNLKVENKNLLQQIILLESKITKQQEDLKDFRQFKELQRNYLKLAEEKEELQKAFDELDSDYSELERRYDIVWNDNYKIIMNKKDGR